MQNEQWFGIVMTLIICLSIISGIASIAAGVYYYHKLEINNFQVTIKDLSPEQKCLHICGFEFDGMLESYKFCAEKCDRISERLNENNGVLKQ